MKKVQFGLGRWVRQAAAKRRASAPAFPASRPVELDTRLLTQVSAGSGTDASLPYKGW